MIENPRTLWLGVIDASGMISKDINWAVALPDGETRALYLQGSVFVSGTTVRTNSAFVLSLD
jgi:hypothetical protein